MLSPKKTAIENKLSKYLLLLKHYSKSLKKWQPAARLSKGLCVVNYGRIRPFVWDGTEIKLKKDSVVLD